MWLSVKRLKFTGAALGCKSSFFTGRNEKEKKTTLFAVFKRRKQDFLFSLHRQEIPGGGEKKKKSKTSFSRRMEILVGA